MSDESAALVAVTRAGRVARLQLNRAAKLNALNSALIASATEAFARFEHERETAVIVLSGAGRCFSAGADVREMQELDEASARAYITRLHDLMALVRDLPQVVIAAVHGYCFGGACELAAACDIRIAADSAVFAMPEIRVGMPSVIEAAIFVPLIGLGRAADFVLTGDEWDAAQAERAGLVSRVVPAAELDTEAGRLAARLSTFSGPALRLQKGLVRAWAGEALDRTIAHGIDVFAGAFRSPNPREAIDALIERRPPRFTEP